MRIFGKHILLVVVFITGACVLVIELVAVRVLSPYYGNTIFSVSSVITVILAALSIGYYAGGKLADRRPSQNLFYGIIVTSGATVLALQILALTLLPYLGYRLSLVSGPLISSTILFFLPGLLLGTLSPFAIKLQKLRDPEEGIGTVAGKMFFWSTCGSIAGSLGAGFILIPHFGVNEIFLGTGVILLAVGMIGMVASGAKGRSILMWVGVSAVLLGSLFSTLAAAKADVVYEIDGLYEKITVYDREYLGRPARFLKQDWSFSSAMFLDSDELVYDYTKYYQLYKIFTPNPKEALAIGAGAYSVPKALLQELPEIHVDVVEIEPVLVEIGKRFFRVPDSSRLVNYIEDGRRFLHDSDKAYDIIFSDVYVSSIPAHFATKEFFEIAKEKLAPEGIFLANIVGDLTSDPPSFVLAEMKTFRTVFPQSYFFAVKSPETEEIQNVIFAGHKSKKGVSLEGSVFREKLVDLSRFDLDLYPLLTDNFAPVEYLTAQIWARRFTEER